MVDLDPIRSSSTESDLTDRNWRLAVYARVSTSGGSQDPEMQFRDLREYAGRRGWTIVAEYVDRGVSGARESRPALNDLMAAAHRRKFDAVLEVLKSKS